MFSLAADDERGRGQRLFQTLPTLILEAVHVTAASSEIVANAILQLID